MAYLSMSPTQNFSVEGYYQYEWKKVKPDPVGSYFSANDLAGKGGTKVMLGFGEWSDLGTDFTPLGGAFDPTSTSCRAATPTRRRTAASTASHCGISPTRSWAAWSSASTTSATTAAAR
jgi:hypothetical protein